MEKGQQYGNFTEAKDIDNIDEFTIMKMQLDEIQEMFISNNDFRGLDLSDFKLEFIVKTIKSYSDEDAEYRNRGIKVPEREYYNTVGWKITKK